jgi:hypothetical protein
MIRALGFCAQSPWPVAEPSGRGEVLDQEVPFGP